MYRVLVVIEKAKDNYSAYCPDLPGCIATGKDREQVEENIHQAIQMHIQGLDEDKLPIPKPHASAEYIAIYKQSSEQTKSA
jgi:predicted RNase H-like HicB family nuclease